MHIKAYKFARVQLLAFSMYSTKGLQLLGTSSPDFLRGLSLDPKTQIPNAAPKNTKDFIPDFLQGLSLDPKMQIPCISVYTFILVKVYTGICIAPRSQKLTTEALTAQV